MAKVPLCENEYRNDLSWITDNLTFIPEEHEDDALYEVILGMNVASRYSIDCIFMYWVQYRLYPKELKHTPAFLVYHFRHMIYAQIERLDIDRKRRSIFDRRRLFKIVHDQYKIYFDSIYNRVINSIENEQTRNYWLLKAQTDNEEYAYKEMEFNDVECERIFANLLPEHQLQHIHHMPTDLVERYSDLIEMRKSTPIPTSFLDEPSVKRKLIDLQKLWSVPFGTTPEKITKIKLPDDQEGLSNNDRDPSTFAENQIPYSQPIAKREAQTMTDEQQKRLEAILGRTDDEMIAHINQKAREEEQEIASEAIRNQSIEVAIAEIEEDDEDDISFSAIDDNEVYDSEENLPINQFNRRMAERARSTSSLHSSYNKDFMPILPTEIIDEIEEVSHQSNSVQPLYKNGPVPNNMPIGVHILTAEEKVNQILDAVYKRPIEETKNKSAADIVKESATDDIKEREKIAKSPYNTISEMQPIWDDIDLLECDPIWVNTMSRKSSLQYTLDRMLKYETGTDVTRPAYNPKFGEWINGGYVPHPQPLTDPIEIQKIIDRRQAEFEYELKLRAERLETLKKHGFKNMPIEDRVAASLKNMPYMFNLDEETSLVKTPPPAHWVKEYATWKLQQDLRDNRYYNTGDEHVAKAHKYAQQVNQAQEYQYEQNYIQSQSTLQPTYQQVQSYPVQQPLYSSPSDLGIMNGDPYLNHYQMNSIDLIKKFVFDKQPLIGTEQIREVCKIAFATGNYSDANYGKMVADLIVTYSNTYTKYRELEKKVGRSSNLDLAESLISESLLGFAELYVAGKTVYSSLVLKELVDKHKMRPDYALSLQDPKFKLKFDTLMTAGEPVPQEYIETTIKLFQDKLANVSMMQNAELLSKFLTQDIVYCNTIDDLQEVFKKMSTEMAMAVSNLSVDSNKDIGMSDVVKGSFFETVIRGEEYHVKTGMSMFDAITNGGFEKDRIYLFGGKTGGGKSTALLNIAYGAYKTLNGFNFTEADLFNQEGSFDSNLEATTRATLAYRKYVKEQKGIIEDPAKTKTKKTILYVTLENTEYETMKRFISRAALIPQNLWMLIERDPNLNKLVKNNFANFTWKDLPNDMPYMLKERIYKIGRYIQFLAQNQEAEFKVWWQPPYSISAYDIMAHIKEMERQNNEIVMVIVDYPDKMKPVESTRSRNDQSWDELGKIIDNLKGMAKQGGFPVIGATQLTREGNKMSNQDTVLKGGSVAGSQQKESNTDTLITMNILAKSDSELSDKFNMFRQFNEHLEHARTSNFRSIMSGQNIKNAKDREQFAMKSAQIMTSAGRTSDILRMSFVIPECQHINNYIVKNRDGISDISFETYIAYGMYMVSDSEREILDSIEYCIDTSYMITHYMYKHGYTSLECVQISNQSVDKYYSKFGRDSDRVRAYNKRISEIKAQLDAGVQDDSNLNTPSKPNNNILDITTVIKPLAPPSPEISFTPPKPPASLTQPQSIPKPKQLEQNDEGVYKEKDPNIPKETFEHAISQKVYLNSIIAQYMRANDEIDAPLASISDTLYKLPEDRKIKREYLRQSMDVRAHFNNDLRALLDKGNTWNNICSDNDAKMWCQLFRQRFTDYVYDDGIYNQIVGKSMTTAFVIGCYLAYLTDIYIDPVTKLPMVALR